MLRFAITILLLCSTVATPLWSQVKAPSSAFKTETKRVAIFKDGHGYFSREGTATLEDGWASADFLPFASYGSVWAYVLQGDAEVTGLIATSDNSIPFKDVDQLRARLADKIGMTLMVKHGETQSQGELTHVLDDMILLKAAGQTLAVRLADVKSASLMSYPLKIGTNIKTGTVTFGIDYLRAGIGWAPTYILDVKDEASGMMTLRATITNGAEDLNGADVFFVVGAPNITMKGQMDPLSQVQIMMAMADGRAAGGVGGFAPAMQNSVGGQLMEDRSAANRPTSNFDSTVPVSGQGYEEMSEFFFYKKEGLSLRTGDVAQINVFTKAVAYRSQFEWTTGTTIWRHMVVQNTTDAPFTTGPVLVVRDGKPISQTVMNFVPVGAEEKCATVMATDVKGAFAEAEIDRGAAEHYSGYDYIPIHMKGTVTVENMRPTEVDIVIHHTVVGNKLEISDDGQIVSTNTQDLNSECKIDWKLKIPAKTKKELTYTMTRYVRAGVK